MEMKKIYYYVICLVSLFILFWGVVDLAGATAGLSVPKTTTVAVGDNEQSLDVFYQKKMLYDRLSDSLARIVVAGLVFVYCRKKVERLEG